MENSRCAIIDQYERFYKLFILRRIVDELRCKSDNVKIINDLYYPIEIKYEDYLNTLNFHNNK